jgi:preprotein translocase subunit SecA
MSIISKIFGSHSERELKKIMPVVDKIEALEPDYQKLSDAELRAKTVEFKERLSKGETLDDLLRGLATSGGRGQDNRRAFLQGSVIGGMWLHQGESQK